MPVQVTLTWQGSGTPVQLDSNGCVTNYPNRYVKGSRSSYFNYRIEIDGSDYSYSNYSSFYELGANDTTKNIGSNLDGAISNVNKIYYAKDGGQVELQFKYGAEGYAIYEKNTNTKVYDVTVKVTKNDTDYALVDGKFNDAGVYKVEYETTINGMNQKFFHNVTVKYNITSDASSSSKALSYEVGQTLDSKEILKGLDTIKYSGQGTLIFAYGDEGYGIYDDQDLTKAIYKATIISSYVKIDANTGKLTEAVSKKSLYVKMTIEGCDYSITVYVTVTEPDAA